MPYDAIRTTKEKSFSIRVDKDIIDGIQCVANWVKSSTQKITLYIYVQVTTFQ